MEPASRNTAASIIAAAHYLAAGYGEAAIMAICPTDHWISDAASFHQQLEQAVVMARDGYLTTLGIAPDHPSTHYGYIVPGDPIANSNGSHIRNFIEKPNEADAAQYIADGACWNSGLFIARCDVVIEQAKHYAPDIDRLCCEALAEATSEGRYVHLAAEAWAEIPSLPFDKAIMEKTEKGAMLPCHFAWTDMGQWQAYYQMANKDSDNNVAHGTAHFYEAAANYVHSETVPVLVQGVDNLAIIVSERGMLVMPKDQSPQKVMTQRCHHDQAGADEALPPSPWGWQRVLDYHADYRVKKLVLLPGECTSRQYHRNRSEYWLVAKGQARVERGEEVQLLHPGDSCFIPAGTTHRIYNDADEELHIIELQRGSALDEQDIVRLEDAYGRA